MVRVHHGPHLHYWTRPSPTSGPRRERRPYPFFFIMLFKLNVPDPMEAKYKNRKQ